MNNTATLLPPTETHTNGAPTNGANGIAGINGVHAPDFKYGQKTFALDDVAGMTEALHEDGFALIPGVLSADEVAGCPRCD